MKKQTFQWGTMTMGVCYYPEHWPRELWADDIDRMKAVGISTLRAAEFAWSILEPREGVFCFDFFDEFLDLCSQKGMKVILGTPTATPPVWLTETWPEVLNADKNGTLLRHGARRHYNYNSPVYRRFCSRIVEQMASHFCPHPAVIGWQIDNELNCETDTFYSEADHQAFRAFVQKKYGTLEKLNAAWGTVFWNQTYSDWNQIHGPRPVLNMGDNPHQLLDYYRFISASTLDFCRMQAEIIRKYKKSGDFITTNGLFGNLDNHQMAQEYLDVYTYDSYPNMAFGLDRNPKDSRDLNDRKWTRNLAEVRSVCPHFGIMEQQSGAGSWVSRMEGPAPRPGQLTLWAMQSVAQGADYISFFRWRTCSFGTEIYWHGILDYDNRDNRKLAEVKDFYQKLRTLHPICGAENVAAFALVRDYDNEWNAQADAWHRRVSRPSEKEIFAASELSHTPYDVVYLRDDTVLSDLTKYPVAFYPHPVLMNEQRRDLLKAYVEQGGTLVIGCRAGYKDMHGQCSMLPQPGLLQALTGTDVRDFTFASPNEEEICMDWQGKRIPAPIFHDILTPLSGTDILAVYDSGYYKGEAVLTEKKLGQGRVLHLGCTFARENVNQLFDYLEIREPFREWISAPEGLEIVMREKDGRKFLFVLNFLDTEQGFELKRPGILLYTGETRTGRLQLPPFGTAVYEVE